MKILVISLLGTDRFAKIRSCSLLFAQDIVDIVLLSASNVEQHAFIEFLRRVVDGEIPPVDAVKAYHGVLQHTGIKPLRPLQQDLLLTTVKMSYR